MTTHHSFTVTVLFLGILSAVRAISASYEDVHLTFPNAARLIYVASESNPSGYSYATQDLNGGGSNVVFATGADSVSKLKKAMNSIYEIDVMMPEKYMQRDMLDDTQDNIRENPGSQEGRFQSDIEASMNKQEDLDLDNVSDEEKSLSRNLEEDSGSFEQQTLPRGVPFVHVPYPAYRANFLNPPSGVLPRYQVLSNAIQNQYYSHNPYAHLQFPLHNFDLYNPSAPLFYQAPIIANQVPVNSLRYTSADVKDTTMSAKASSMEDSRTNSTKLAVSVESNIPESRSNIEPMENKVEEASSTESALTTLELTSTSKDTNEEMTTTPVKPIVKSRKCGDQTVGNKASSIESENIKVSTSTKEPSTEASVLTTTEI